MSSKANLRKVIAAALISASVAIAGLHGGVASADGGGVVGASQSITVGSNQTESYWPGVTKYTDVNLGRAPDRAEPPTEVVTFVFHEIKNHAGTGPSVTNVTAK